MIHDKQSAQISQKQNDCNIYAIMKTMCPPGYHHNGFVVTHALWEELHEFPQSHSGDNRVGGKLFS